MARSRSTTVSPATADPRPRRPDRRGLTLLELVLVLSLLLVLGALVLPAVESVQDEAAWSADQWRLKAGLEEVRATSIDQGTMLLVYDTGEGMLVACPPGEDEDALPPPLVEIAVPSLVPRISLVPGIPDEQGADDTALEMPVEPRLVLVCLPDGEARIRSPIMLYGDDGMRAAVQVEALTGTVHVRELKPADEPNTLTLVPDDAVDTEP